MPKFYVACGSQNLVVASDSAEQAAFRLVDEALATHIWIYEDTRLTEQDRHDHLVLEALLHLGTTIRVSERGTGRDDAGQFGMPELINQWHRLMTSLSRVLSDAGLESDRCFPTFEIETQRDGKRLPK